VRPIEQAPKEAGNDGDVLPSAQTSCSIDWYAEGQFRTVEVDGVQIRVRFIGRKGRRGRIEIEAPAGAVFEASDGAKPHSLLQQHTR
jgi:hypothetical protein